MLRMGALVMGASLLSGCDLLGDLFRPVAPAVSAPEQVYRTAMADLSACVTDPTGRVAAAARLAHAAAILQDEPRPTDPDHFFWADRVSAAADHCAGAAGR
jgi:hypothetical protein